MHLWSLAGTNNLDPTEFYHWGASAQTPIKEVLSYEAMYIVLSAPHVRLILYKTNNLLFGPTSTQRIFFPRLPANWKTSKEKYSDLGI